MVAVPELPDLRILAEAFTAALVGRPLQRTVVRQPLVLRGTDAELRELRGPRPGDASRSAASS